MDRDVVMSKLENLRRCIQRVQDMRLHPHRGKPRWTGRLQGVPLRVDDGVLNVEY